MAIISGTPLDDVLITTAAADTLAALDGNDIILVAAAADHAAPESINGGGGADRIWFTSSGAGETLVLLAAVTGVEAVELSDGAGNNTGTVGLSINAGAVATGLVLIGNDGDNTLTGTARDDVIAGRDGIDTVFGGGGNDRIFMSLDGNFDTIDAGDAAEGNSLVLVGAAAGLVVVDLATAAGADQLISIDTVPDGAVQSDFRHVDASELLGGGLQATGSALANTLIGSAQNDTITGGAGADIVTGALGDDLFLVAAGADFTVADLLNGGPGSDTVRFTSTSAGQTLTLHAKVLGIEFAEIADADGDTSGTAAVNLNAAAVATSLTLTGNDGANALTGTRFADTLIGNAGADRLSGGAANDLYVVESGPDSVAGDVITDSGGTADYIVFTSAVDGETLTLGAQISGIDGVYISDLNLSTAGTTQLDIDARLATVGLAFNGNDGDNAIAGGRGNDTIIGNGGSDTIDGGLGSDIVEMNVASPDRIDAGLAAEGNTLRLAGTAAGMVEIDLSVAAGADQILAIGGAGEALLQTGFRHVDAATLAGAGIAVTGSAAASRIVGSPQADVFILGLPSHLGLGDVITGGNGDDVLRFTSAVAGQTLVLGGQVTGVEQAEIGDAAGDTSGTTALNLNAAAVRNPMALVGNDGANVLTGTAGNDTINGNGGADTLAGGPGADLYIVDGAAEFAGDRITDTAGADTLNFGSATDGEALVLPASLASIEEFVLGGTAGTGIDGSALRYGAKFTGNDGANNLKGGLGSDTIAGGLGADTIAGGAGNDRIVMTFEGGTEDEIDAGNALEGNTLVLVGEQVGVVVDLRVGADGDQLIVPGSSVVQSDFSHVDASGMSFRDPDPANPNDFVAGIAVAGSSRANVITGTEANDLFVPGLGNDTVEGGGGDDIWVVTTQAEYDGDLYTDNGITRGDSIVFAGTAHGQTLIIRNNVAGVDGADADTFSTLNLNIDASGVLQPFGLGGNLGNNMLIGTFNGESYFDPGGRDTVNGGGGSDDYVIFSGAWVAGDRIIDPSGEQDGVYFVGDEGEILVVNFGATMTGIEQFVVSSADLSTGGPYVRDNTSTNGAGIDASRYPLAIELAGSNGNNALTGTAFADFILGFGGQDTIVGGRGADTITMEVEAASIDRIDAGAQTEGNSLLLKGVAGGVIEMDLGAADQLVEIGGVAEDLVQTGFTHVDAAEVTREGAEPEGVVIFGSAVANILAGTALNDVLMGRAGADTLAGDAGDDAFVVNAQSEIAVGEQMRGGAGVDAIWFASAVAGQTLRPSAASATDIEKMMVADEAGSTAGVTPLNLDASNFATAMILEGNDGANVLTGTRGADSITGNGGADILIGGAGNDVYLVEAGGDVVAGETITDSAGTDTLRFTSETPDDSVVLTGLMRGLEVAEIGNVAGILTGTTALSLDASAVVTALTIRGNDGANVLTGTSQNDTFHGNGGNDSIDAGTGADTIHMSTESAALDDVDAGARSEGNTLVLSGVAGGAMVWDLTSDTDQLLGIGGADDGHVFRGITSIDASAIDTSAMGPAGVTITGSTDANRLVGTGIDDSFVTATPFVAGDGIAGGAGRDVLRFSSTTAGQTLVVGANVTGIEAVAISDAAGATTGTTALNLDAAAAPNGLDLTGNDGDNQITGTARADRIEGNGGRDTITAGAGADEVTMQVGAGSIDAINAGLASENNFLILEGTAAGGMVLNLAAADQIVSIGGIAEALVQTGFAGVDASAVDSALSITGSAGADRIAGGSGSDTIVAGAGADIVSMSVAPGALDSIDAGALAEGNTLVLTGAATGDATLDLSAAGDQLAAVNGGADALVQSGFAHLDASDMAGAAVIVTGSAAANRITGTAGADTILAGAGADTVVMDVAAFDTLDAGSGPEGDTLVLTGMATGVIAIDLSAGADADQLVSIEGVAEGAVQSDFQHLDASLLDAFGVNVRGNDLSNVLTGTRFADTFAGLGGSDRVDLGTTTGAGGTTVADGAADVIVFESGADGVSSAAAAFSRDRFIWFEPGKDSVAFGGAFNGGDENLDDIADDDAFAFASDTRADFTSTDEALFISSAKSGLLAETALYQAGLPSVVLVINRVGVTSAAGDDGLIAVQTRSATGIYYYEELDGRSGVSAGELTLLGVLDAKASAGDFGFV